MRDLSKRFGNRMVLDGLTLDIKAGEFVAMIGRSGSGKSTLLRALAGLDRDVSGSMAVAEPVAVAFQEPRLVPWKRVLDNVTLGLRAPDPARVASRGARGGRAHRADVGLAADPVRRRGAAGLAGPRAGQVARRCSCSTSRSAPWTR